MTEVRPVAHSRLVMFIAECGCGRKSKAEGGPSFLCHHCFEKLRAAAADFTPSITVRSIQGTGRSLARRVEPAESTT
jgi:hypothetical protein